jgi:hypothetical protein
MPFILKKQSFSSQFPNVKEIMIYTFLLFYPECFTFRYRQVNAESVYKIEILLFGGNLYCHFRFPVEQCIK